MTLAEWLILGRMSPRFLAIGERLVSLPLARRRAAWEAWLATQPDAESIRETMAAVDPFGPQPPSDGADVRAN